VVTRSSAVAAYADLSSLPRKSRIASDNAGRRNPKSRGDCPVPKDNRYSLDIATLAIFPEYVEFDGEDVLKLVVQGEAGRTIK
jgi:hypothetical protein